MSLKWGFWVPVVLILCAVIFSFPLVLAINIQREQARITSNVPEPFPVTVDPVRKLIVESEEVNAFFDTANSPFQAAVGNVGNVFVNLFDWIAVAVSDLPLYQSMASVAGAQERLVNITPGMRKEQVASAFAKALKWNAKQKKEFMTAETGEMLPLFEGSFSPGIYIVTPDMTPKDAQNLVNDRFTSDILSRYSSETEKIVPLSQALTIASLIEREAGGADDRRIISGVIWNRLFINMNLQVDATLQYAKANTPSAKSWWPTPLPADRFRKSPYNTYLNKGLPPTPIASPSVASVLAALNPKNTDCLFYFHDSVGRFHCSDTYAGHVSLLKKYFGRGK